MGDTMWTYKKYKEAGLCVLCGGVPSQGTIMCEKHRVERITRQRAWYASNPDYQRKQALKKKYNLTTEEYTQLLDSQENKCAICKEELVHDKKTRTYAHIDHCHTTGKVRGILCPMCNKGLGHFVDSPERLRAAADYLEA